MQVKLKKEDFQAMAAHAIANLPEEACGLIAGEKSDTERVIKKVYYLTNIDHTNEHFSYSESMNYRIFLIHQGHNTITCFGIKGKADILL